MRRLYFTLLAIAVLFGINACSFSDDGESFHYEPLVITKVELPDSFTLNEIYEIKVSVLRPDDCTLIEGFDVRRLAQTTRSVSAVGLILEKESCTTLDKEVENSFRFEVLYTDPYLFKFYTGKDADGEPTYIEVTVPVN